MKVKNYHHCYHWKIYCDDNSSLSSIILINLFASLFLLVIFLLFFLSCFLLILFSLLLLFLSFLFFFLKKTLRNVCCVFKTWRKRGCLSFSANKRRCHDNVDTAALFTVASDRVQSPEFYSSLLSCLAFEWKWGWRWPCFDRNLLDFLMLMMLFSC